MRTVAPRFKDLPAGFTKVELNGRRRVDKAVNAIIEILGNPQMEFEKNEELVTRQENNLKTFWEFETGLLD